MPFLDYELHKENKEVKINGDPKRDEKLRKKQELTKTLRQEVKE